MAEPPVLGGGQPHAEVELAAGEPFDDQHDAGANWTAWSGWLGPIEACCHAEQHTAAFKRSTPSAVGEESEVKARVEEIARASAPSRWRIRRTGFEPGRPTRGQPGLRDHPA